MSEHTDDQQNARLPERQRGPILLRREQISGESSTTDQRLLDSRGTTDWVHTDPWRTVTR